MCLLIFFNHLLFLQTFNGNNLASPNFLTEPDLAKSSSADNLDGLKILFTDFLPFPTALLHLLMKDLVFDMVLLGGG